jgi:hypothetical protein
MLWAFLLRAAPFLAGSFSVIAALGTLLRRPAFLCAYYSGAIGPSWFV